MAKDCGSFFLLLIKKKKIMTNYYEIQGNNIIPHHSLYEDIKSNEVYQLEDCEFDDFLKKTCKKSMYIQNAPDFLIRKIQDYSKKIIIK